MDVPVIRILVQKSRFQRSTFTLGQQSMMKIALPNKILCIVLQFSRTGKITPFLTFLSIFAISILQLNVFFIINQLERLDEQSIH